MPRKLFEMLPCGDPYSSHVWVREYETSFNDQICIFRGDLPHLRQTAMRAYLKRLYPACIVRWALHG